MMSSVCVTGNLNDLTTEDLELFFESHRFCPNGGDVKEVQWSSKDRVTITFLDGKVAQRLEREILMPGGVKLSVEPLHEGSGKAANDLNNSRKLEADSVNGNGSRAGVGSSGAGCSIDNVKKTDNWGTRESEAASTLSRSSHYMYSSGSSIDSVKSYHSSSGNAEDSPANQDIAKRSSLRFSSSSSCSSSSQSGIQFDFNTDSSCFVNKTINQNLPVNANKTPNGGKSSASLENVSKKKSSEVKTVVPKPVGKARNYYDFDDEIGWNNNEQPYLDRSDSYLKGSYEDVSDFALNDNCWESDGHAASNSTLNDTTQKLSFSVEKFSLLQLVLHEETKSLTNGCKLTFDENQHLVVITGPSDEAMCLVVRAHEVVLQAVSGSVNISSQVQKLLLSAKGKVWLANEFSREHLFAVFYTKEGRSHIIARDDLMLLLATSLLSKAVVSKTLPFDDGAVSFLQTLTWAKKVEGVESSGVVCVETDYSQKSIIVSGSVTDLNVCVKEIQNLLRNNVSTSRCIKHKIGVVRLLKGQMHSINEEINKVVRSKVSLEFPQKETIQVSGYIDDVQEAVRLIENKYLKSVCYDKYQVNMKGLTLDMFTRKNSPGNDLIDLLELRSKCVIEVRGDSTRMSEHDSKGASARPVERVVVRPARRKKNRIHLLQGNIVEFKADVLVNTIAHQMLERAGVVSQCFIKAGGSRLYQELRQSVPQDFGNDVSVTSAGGRLNAKFIFHAAIRKYRNRGSTDRLYSLIKKCLEMAAQQGASSIAFPTLGCGKLNYDPREVADCFNQAMKNTRTNIQVSIIAFEDHILRDLKSHLTADSSPASSDNETDEASGFVGKVKRFFGSLTKPRDAQANPSIVFHINAMSNDVLKEVRAFLASKISEMVTEVPIRDEVIGDLRYETMAKIEALNSSDVDIRIDKVQKTITVKGTKSAVEQVKLKVLQMVYKEGQMDERTGNFQTQGSVRYPKYWQSLRRGKQPSQRASTTEIFPGSSDNVFEEVSQVVMKTWEPQKVGHGNDAAGLGNHSIKIRKIFCIENPTLYRTYMAKREEFLLAARYNRFQPVAGSRGEKEIMTRNLGLTKLDTVVEHKINECYLLHGTKIDTLESIKHTGLDSRLSGTSVMFGNGTYFTESSTKADQYADSKSQRKPNGSPLYMVVCRVLLGNSFICQTPTQYKRPPCMQPGCYSDLCPTQHKHVGNFDSIIGTHKSANVRLIFREFVIYHPDHSYPDFLVEYQRQ